MIVSMFYNDRGYGTQSINSYDDIEAEMSYCISICQDYEDAKFVLACVDVNNDILFLHFERNKRDLITWHKSAVHFMNAVVESGLLRYGVVDDSNKSNDETDSYIKLLNLYRKKCKEYEELNEKLDTYIASATHWNKIACTLTAYYITTKQYVDQHCPFGSIAAFTENQLPDGWGFGEEE